MNEECRVCKNEIHDDMEIIHLLEAYMITEQINQSPLLSSYLLTPQQVAAILNISRSQAYRLLQSGGIPSVRIGKSVRVRQQDLQGYITENLFGVERS